MEWWHDTQPIGSLHYLKFRFSISRIVLSWSPFQNFLLTQPTAYLSLHFLASYILCSLNWATLNRSKLCSIQTVNYEVYVRGIESFVIASLNLTDIKNASGNIIILNVNIRNITTVSEWKLLQLSAMINPCAYFCCRLARIIRMMGDFWKVSDMKLAELCVSFYSFRILLLISLRCGIYSLLFYGEFVVNCSRSQESWRLRCPLSLYTKSLNAFADVNNFDKRLSLTCGIHLPINNSRVNLFFSGTRLSCNCFPRNASKLNIVILQLDVGTNQIIHFQSLTFNYFYRVNNSFFLSFYTRYRYVCVRLKLYLEIMLLLVFIFF